MSGTLKQKITILGAGALASAVANIVAENGYEVVLYSNEESSISEINAEHSNGKYVSGKLHSNITATVNVVKALEQAVVIFIILPSKVVAGLLGEIAKLGQKNFREKFVIFTKGLDEQSGEFFSDMIPRYFPGSEVAVFSGPNFAEEIFEKKVTVTTLATKNRKFFDELIQVMRCDFLTITYFDDPIAVQLCGLVKNVAAVICGIIEGLEMGKNVFSFLIMKTLWEIMSFCKLFHRNENVLLTPAGIGDIVLTCTSHKSRNFSSGLRIGRGEKVEDIFKNTSTTLEGIGNARSLYNMSTRFKMEKTIAELLLNIIENSPSREQLSEAIVEYLTHRV
ncbi:MAG: NAD(P)-binding domain-containing protein [Rickettsiales bacterium]|jgi:glycerol-3-phosphate dehydrogenase (NAD(P)+)|nr:NAD(P)-binding domain-containing protein [Rickettsiales bacterium]